MLRCCNLCRAEASPELHLQYCAVCQSALYCSEACQRKDCTRKQHRQICKLLNVGHGDMQLRTRIHTSRSISLKEQVERIERSLDKGRKRFFKLFEESTFEGSRPAALEMKEIAERQTKDHQKFLLFLSLHILVRSSDSEILSWPNSPLLMLLQFVDPSVLSGAEDEPLQEGETRVTPLHLLAELADPSDYSTHENQLILATQLIEHGANVSAVSIPQGATLLHPACPLLKQGVDPNYQDYLGKIPLMLTIPYAPGAAKFLLNWPTKDVNITTRSRASFLANVRSTITEISDKVALPEIPGQVKHQFLLQQWRDIEGMLMERGAQVSGITAIL
jgi:hypothetical protein